MVHTVYIRVLVVIALMVLYTPWVYELMYVLPVYFLVLGVCVCLVCVCVCVCVGIHWKLLARYCHELSTIGSLYFAM